MLQNIALSMVKYIISPKARRVGDSSYTIIDVRTVHMCTNDCAFECERVRFCILSFGNICVYLLCMSASVLKQINFEIGCG